MNLKQRVAQLQSELQEIMSKLKMRNTSIEKLYQPDKICCKTSWDRTYGTEYTHLRFNGNELTYFDGFGETYVLTYCPFCGMKINIDE